MSTFHVKGDCAIEYCFVALNLELRMWCDCVRHSIMNYNICTLLKPHVHSMHGDGLSFALTSRLVFPQGSTQFDKMIMTLSPRILHSNPTQTTPWCPFWIHFCSHSTRTCKPSSASIAPPCNFKHSWGCVADSCTVLTWIRRPFQNCSPLVCRQGAVFTR